MERMENSDGVVFYKHGTDPIIAEQAEQIARLTNALGAITYINPSERCAENKMIEIAKEALEHIDGIGNVIVWKGNSDE